MKKLMSCLLIALLTACLGLTGLAEVGMANPWVETTAEEMAQTIGVELGVPEGAENIVWRMMPEVGMGEMTFTWDGMDYTARVQPTAEFEDISGLYYEWEHEEPCQVSWCEGKLMRTTDADQGLTIDLCLWFDVVPGVMYAVSASAPDLDGFDILAAAEQLFVPMQGDA